MKRKRLLIALLVIGVVLWWFGFYVTSFIPDDVRRFLIYAGPVIIGICAGRLHRLRRLARDPALRRKDAAQNDEQNMAIQNQAGMIAGGVIVILLSFSAMAFSLITSLGVPEWISYFLFGICVCYLLVYVILYRWLQRKM